MRGTFQGSAPEKSADFMENPLGTDAVCRSSLVSLSWERSTPTFPIAFPTTPVRVTLQRTYTSDRRSRSYLYYFFSAFSVLFFRRYRKGRD